MTKTQKIQQELAMQDLEIAALKLDVLTQKEIAANNKDAYEATNERLETIQQHYKDLNDDCINLESKLIKAQEEVKDLKSENENWRLKCNSIYSDNLERLAKIPKWVQWLFGI